MKKLLLKLSVWFLKTYSDENTRHELLTELIKNFYNTVSSEDILKLKSDGSLIFEGKTLDAYLKKDLKDQAIILDKLFIWKVLKKDVQYHLNKKLFYDSGVKEDLVSAKLLIYLFQEVIDKRINQLKKL